jgi:hypothetical protein
MIDSVQEGWAYLEIEYSENSVQGHVSCLPAVQQLLPNTHATFSPLHTMLCCSQDGRGYCIKQKMCHG